METKKDDTISRQEAIDALWKAMYEYEDKIEKQFQESNELDISDWISHRIFVQNMSDIDRQTILNLPPAQPENTKEYNLKKIYNIYVKIAQAHFLYQPSKPKTITAMPFDWIEVQNLLEKYLEDHGADFDALCREYVSENVKDDYLLSAQPETCEGCKHLGKWENEVEYGYPSPCTRCKRRVEDHYER